MREGRGEKMNQNYLSTELKSLAGFTPLPTRTLSVLALSSGTNNKGRRRRKWNHRPTKKEARCSRHLDSISAFRTWRIPTTSIHCDHHDESKARPDLSHASQRSIQSHASRQSTRVISHRHEKRISIMACLDSGGVHRPDHGKFLILLLLHAA